MIRYGLHRVGDECSEYISCFSCSCVRHQSAEGFKHVSYCPAGNYCIIRQDHESAEAAHPSYEGPGSASEFPEGTNRVRLSIAPDNELRQHYRHTDKNDYRKINKDKSRSAIFPRDVGEPPDITKTNR